MAGAARSLGSLTLDMLLKIASFERDTEKVSKSTQKRMKEIEKAAEKAGKVLGVALVAGVTAAVYAIGQAQKAVGDFQDMAEKVGDTAENFASLKRASDVTSVSMDTVAAASVKLTAILSKTDDESKGAGAAIAALGLNFDEFRQLAPADQLDAVAKAMQGFKDGAAKTAVAVALFGKSGADILPFLNELATASQRQIGLTNAQIKAADDYGDALAGVMSDNKLAFQQLSVELIPAQTKALQLFNETLKYLSDIVRKTDLAANFAVAANNVDSLRKQIERIREGGLTFLDQDQIDALPGKLIAAQAELKKFTDQAISGAVGLESFNKAVANVPSKYYVFGSGDKPSLDFDQAAIDAANKARDEADKKRKKAIEDAASEAKRADEQMKAAGKSLSESVAAPIDALNAQSREIDKLYNGGYINAETRTRALADANAKYYESLTALDPAIKAQIEAENTLQDVIDNAQRDLLRAAEAGVQNSASGGLYSGVDSAVSTASGLENDRYAKQREELLAAQEQEGVDIDLAHQAIEAAEKEHQARLGQIAEDGQKAKNEITQTYLKAGNEIFANLSDAAQSLGLEKSKAGFEISKQINAIQAGINTATAITNALAVSPYWLGQALATSAGIAGFAQIAMIENAKFPGYATGGIVPGGQQLIQVNEHGEEFVMPAAATRANRGLLEAMRAGMPMIAPPSAGSLPSSAMGGSSMGVDVHNYGAADGYEASIKWSDGRLQVMFDQAAARGAQAGAQQAVSAMHAQAGNPSSQFNARLRSANRGIAARGVS